jgi:hypothetical protein
MPARLRPLPPAKPAALISKESSHRRRCGLRVLRRLMRDSNSRGSRLLVSSKTGRLPWPEEAQSRRLDVRGPGDSQRDGAGPAGREVADFAHSPA